ncbi:MAG: MupG family TIM beta-alpha barrel fold protein, partial [Spirochaetaceae bacterium]|nr:MupG family TIM beta-alpha barrel fold protein [Spirochaetaceae bacterium]
MNVVNNTGETRELGISVYPEFTSLPELENYVSLAASLGFSRAFMSFILKDLDFKGALPPDSPVFEKAFALCGDRG